jgi:hypothetical protein
MDEVFEQYLAGFISEGELAEARRLSLAGKIKRKVSSAVSLVKGKIKLKTGSIKTHPVTSSNVKEVGYKPGKDNLGELYVVFKNGTLYRYDGVPNKKFESLLSAESKGKFLHKEIKLPNYKYTKLS